MLRRAGKGTRDTVDAVAGALGHRPIRDEYLDPGESIYRTRLDADAAGDLISAYAARRADHQRLQARQARRRARMDRRRDPEGARAGSGSPQRAGDGNVEDSSAAGAVDGGVTQGGWVRSRINLLPIVVGCGLLLLLACTQIVAA